MSNEIDSLYNDLLQAQLDKDWRKADELQRKIGRLEEAETRLVECPVSRGSQYDVYEVEAPYAR
jgi:hypothetical protein